MLRLIWRLCRLVVVVLVLGLGLYIAGPFLLSGVGRYLITQDPLAKADLVLVLAGETFLRVPEAARLYHEGLAPAILLTNEPRPPGLQDLLRVGIRFPVGQELALDLLRALRVPRRAIRTIQERSINTQAEMEAVARFLKRQPVRTLIIVTSKSHSTRARKIFAAGLGPTVRLIMHPVPSDPFDPTRWWQDRTDFKQVLHEYQALADLWRIRLWRKVVGAATAVPPPVTVQ